MKLNAATAQLHTVTKESAREVSILKADLESEKEARRGWQDKAVTLRERLTSMVCKSEPLYKYWLILWQEQARFVLVLIDADADNYLVSGSLLLRNPADISVS